MLYEAFKTDRVRDEPLNKILNWYRVDFESLTEELALEDHNSYFVLNQVKIRRRESPMHNYEKDIIIHNIDEWRDFLDAAQRSHWVDYGQRAASEDRRRELELAAQKANVREASEAQIAASVDPDHYQGFVMDLQWLEAQQYIYSNNPDEFAGGVSLQVRKYLDRLGKKDMRLQELKKSLWYLKFLVAWEINNREPIRVADVDSILRGEK